jgi:tetratricopeptide (TPR) repeat protein
MEDDGENETEETQLAMSRPQINSQLRVQAAPNTPARASNAADNNDEYLRETLFSPTAMQNLGGKSKNPPLPTSLMHVEQQANVKNLLKEFSTMALSNNRVGRKDLEALAYSSIGIIHDNLDNFKHAITSYQQYLQLSVESNDVSAQMKALNFLGVDYTFIAMKIMDTKNLSREESLDDHVNKNLQLAISYHQRHFEIADDGGKFVAYNNLGLCYDLLGNLVEAARSHQNALRLAIKLQSLHGQSVSVGNLGLLAMKKCDFSTAKTCFEQHRQLTQSLQDIPAEINAWKLIAKLFMLEGELAQAQESLLQARTKATNAGLLNELRIINCLLGEVRASESFDAYVDELLSV